MVATAQQECPAGAAEGQPMTREEETLKAKLLLAEYANLIADTDDVRCVVAIADVGEGYHVLRGGNRKSQEQVFHRLTVEHLRNGSRWGRIKLAGFLLMTALLP